MLGHKPYKLLEAGEHYTARGLCRLRRLVNVVKDDEMDRVLEKGNGTVHKVHLVPRDFTRRFSCPPATG
jgi:hypothetical protein